MNRAEALIPAGRTAEASAQAHQTLAVLERPGELSPDTFDAPHYPPGFDLLGIEWERASWRHAGDPEAEQEAKRSLLRCWLHSILADLTGNPNHYMSAHWARPDLPPLRAALGCALARNHRMTEALPLLRRAVTANPFDRVLARALHQALDELGDWPELARFVQEQLDLHKAAPRLAPLEDWFRSLPLTGDERASIIILACNEAHFTRLCLESVLRNTHGDYELILVDNGSSDETPSLFKEFAQ